jgi:hypothetical protein
MSVRSSCQRRRGATLLLVLIILVLAVTLASRQVMQNTALRLAGAGENFRDESLWIAEGVASQWALRSATPTVSTDALVTPANWTLGRYGVEVWPSSSQDKLQVVAVPVDQWLPFYRQRSQVPLVEDPQRMLLQRGSGAIELFLDSTCFNNQDAYLNERGATAPADLLTVWGSGKVDLNHCPRDILSIRLHGFTDAQISGILRLREQASILRLDHLADALSLTEHQLSVLQEVATLRPEVLELVIRVKKGALVAMYHAAIAAGPQPRVLEVRSVE